MHDASEQDALTRLRLRHMCGGPGRDGSAHVDTQVFRPFHFSSDLLAAEVASAVATDALTLEECEVITQVRRPLIVSAVCHENP